MLESGTRQPQTQEIPEASGATSLSPDPEQQVPNWVDLRPFCHLSYFYIPYLFGVRLGPCMSPSLSVLPVCVCAAAENNTEQEANTEHQRSSVCQTGQAVCRRSCLTSGLKLEIRFLKFDVSNCPPRASSVELEVQLGG